MPIVFINVIVMYKLPENGLASNTYNTFDCYMNLVYNTGLACKMVQTQPQEEVMQNMKKNKQVIDEDDEIKASASQTVGFVKLLSYADAWDWTMMVLGTLGSVVHGMAFPVGYLLLGKALNAFGNNIHDTDAMVKALNRVMFSES